MHFLRTHMLAAAILSVLFAGPVSLRAQNAAGEEHLSRLRVGILVGIQTNIQRHTVFPYTGEFQELIGESAAFGVTAGYRFSSLWSVKTEVSWWTQDWSTAHDGDPRIRLSRKHRAFLEIPVMLAAHPPLDFIPLYVAAGPVLMIATSPSGERSYELQYATFTERNGWQKSTHTYDDRSLRLGAVAEIGLDIPLGTRVSLLTSARFLHPFGTAVDEEALTVRDFSYWRFALGVQLGI